MKKRGLELFPRLILPPDKKHINKSTARAMANKASMEIFEMEKGEVYKSIIRKASEGKYYCCYAFNRACCLLDLINLEVELKSKGFEVDFDRVLYEMEISW